MSASEASTCLHGIGRRQFNSRPLRPESFARFMLLHRCEVDRKSVIVFVDPRGFKRNRRERFKFIWTGRRKGLYAVRSKMGFPIAVATEIKVSTAYEVQMDLE